MLWQTDASVEAELASSLRETRVRAGQALFERGEAGDCMFVVKAGKLVALDGDDTLVTFTPGDTFGEHALLEGIAGRPFTCVAPECDALCYSIDGATLAELCGEALAEARAAVLPLDSRSEEQTLAALALRSAELGDDVADDPKGAPRVSFFSSGVVARDLSAVVEDE